MSVDTNTITIAITINTITITITILYVMSGIIVILVNTITMNRVTIQWCTSCLV